MNDIQNDKPGVAILCLDEFNNILIILSYRYAINKKGWEIPRGGLKAGESNINSVKREIKEECNINKIKSIHLLESIYPDSLILASKIQIMLIRVNREDNNIKLQINEDIIDYKWISKKEIKEWIKEGKIKDPFLLSALSFL